MKKILSGPVRDIRIKEQMTSGSSYMYRYDRDRSYFSVVFRFLSESIKVSEC